MATPADAAEIAALRAAVAVKLTRDFGPGHWSSSTSEPGVLRGIDTSRVVVARDGAGIAGTLRLVTKRPWAIDSAYFTVVERPLYLVDMAVRPDAQRTGIGRRLCAEAIRLAREWPAESIRLDAYDDAAGAGPFYLKCGFREVGRATYRSVPLIYFEALLTG